MISATARKYLYFSVFAAGMTTLAVELSAARLLGNIFGTSNLVWASIIGLILIYLTVGYFIGGRWADRSPHLRTMYLIMVWGAFLIGLVPLVANPVLKAAADAFDQFQVGILCVHRSADPVQHTGDLAGDYLPLRHSSGHTLTS